MLEKPHIGKYLALVLGNPKSVTLPQRHNTSYNSS